MKTISFLATLISLTIPLSTFGQKILSTNATAPPTEESLRLDAEYRSVRQRTSQILANSETTMRTNVAFMESRGWHREMEYLLQQQRLLVVRPLINLIATTNSWEAKDSAAAVLGDYRAFEAIPCLVSNIQQDTKFKMFSSIVTPDQAKPFGAALANIGEPSVAPVLDRIGTEDEERVADRCREVIVRILGPQRSIEAVQKRADEATDEKVKGRFKRVLAKIKN